MRAGRSGTLEQRNAHGVKHSTLKLETLDPMLRGASGEQAQP
jgi:hypothetical protein